MFSYRKWAPILCLTVLFFTAATFADSAASLMNTNPESRPWVYWFFKNGNISRDGITADLEAMQRVGIGGAIIMEVALSVPPGPVKFFSDEWRQLFAFAVAEADRLGLKLCINSAPGWTGSGGPWITPELSMKKVTASETVATGPSHFDAVLPQPETLCGYYKDIAVLAFPTPVPGARIEDIEEKALYKRGPFSSMPGVRPHFESKAEYPAIPAEQTIALAKLVDISANMDASGHLVWDVPEGNWTIMRFGCTSTGQTNRPAPLPGLECDKMDSAALDAHFDAYIRKIVADAGPHAGKSLVATHFDSWEVGGQNWTSHFREEFQQRRGYDLAPYLPAMTGKVVESLDLSERFLWDLRQTVSEMIAQYHGQRMRELAHGCGLELSIEPYDMTPCDDMTLGAAADIPMCEFWSDTFDTKYSVREATSIGHVYGQLVVAAEAFTSIDKWLLYPGAIKPNGDWAFSEGVNKMVIHRYIHQPFPTARPGLSLGPHGLHYERTATWWDYSHPWHEYLARCQSALRNAPVADALYLSPEGAPNVFQGPDPGLTGYKYDACTPEALLTRIACKDGCLVNALGTKWRLLVLPDSPAATPAILDKIRQLAEAGATIVGPPPAASPSLSGYPQCDQDVQAIAATVWNGEQRPAQRTERKTGSGRILWGGEFNTALPSEATESVVAQSNWIWCAADASGLDAPPCRRYFRRVVTVKDAASLREATLAMTADNSFRMWVDGQLAGRGENFGKIYSFDVTKLMRQGENLIAVEVENGDDAPNPAGLIGTLVLRYADGSEEMLRTDAQWQSAPEKTLGWNKDVAKTGDWKASTVMGPMGMPPWGAIREAASWRGIYPPSKAIEGLLAEMGIAPDFEASAPLRFNHRITPKGALYFVSNGEAAPVSTQCVFRVNSGKPVLLHPEDGSAKALPECSTTPDGRTAVPLHFDAGESYIILFEPDAEAQTEPAAPSNYQAPKELLTIAGPWTVTFDPASGGPEKPVVFNQLEDWSKAESSDIRYYSGTAAYTCDFELPADFDTAKQSLLLDLGNVEIVASVKLNGQDAGIAWKNPYRVAVGAAAHPGKNTLEIRVANLWVNRLIGDEKLPPDSNRNQDGTLKSWPQWLLDGKTSPTGRHCFATWRHWTADDPLRPSGLLGPVRLLRE